jgi:hypothetical protein
VVEIGKLVLDSFQVPLGNPADFRAARAILSGQPKKIADLMKRKSQIAAPPNEPKPSRMLLVVGAVISNGAFRGREHTYLFVITNSDNSNAGIFRQLSDA